MKLLLLGILVLAGLVLLYRSLPYRPLPPRPPRLALFPKYWWTAPDTPTLLEGLKRHGFERSGYASFVRRGGLSGASLPRFRVDVLTERRARLAGGALILFDTGDVWKLAADLGGAPRLPDQKT